MKAEECLSSGHLETLSLLSTVQASLNKYVALLRIESDPVGNQYQELVAATRRIAGPAIAQGWDLPVRTGGTDMHVQDVDLSALNAFDDAFMTAARLPAKYNESSTKVRQIPGADRTLVCPMGMAVPSRRV